MFLKLLKFEISLQTKQLGFWISAILVALAAFLFMSFDFLSLGGSGGGERTKANGAIPLANLISFWSYIAIFFGAIFVVTGVMRDDVHKSLELIHVTPVKTSSMIWSRFLGVWLTTFLCVLAGVVGMYIGTLAPWMDKEAIQGFNALHYVQPIVYFALINTLFVTAFYTAIAGITRNRSMVYVSAVGLFMLTQVAGIFSINSENDLLTSLISPFGDSALAKVTEFWPPAEQNENMVPMGGLIGANRLLWGLLSILALVASTKLFPRGIVEGKQKRLEADDQTEIKIGMTEFASAATTHDFAASLSQFWTRFKFDTLTTIKSVPFIILALLGLGIFGINIFVQGMFNPEPVLPISSQVAGLVTGGFAFFIYIIMVFFAGEIMWRDRLQGMNEVIDATPARNGVFMASKWAAMMAIIAAALLFAMLCGMLIQLGLGRTAVQPLVYFKSIFVSVGTPLFLFAALTLMIQSLAPGRVIGMLISAVVLIGLLLIVAFVPFNHPLMNYGMVSTGGFSDMNGFGNLTRWSWFLAYWSALAVFFGVLSVWLWRRGVEVGLIKRIREIGRSLSKGSVGVALASLLAFAAVGSYIYKSYDANDYNTSKQAELRLVAFENALWDKVQDPQPSVTDVKSDVRFYPEKGTAKVIGQFNLENRYDTPITEMFVGMGNLDEISEVSITGTSEQDQALTEVIRERKKFTPKSDGSTNDIKDAKSEDAPAPLKTKASDYTLADFGYRRFVFKTPLAPGAKAQMDFTVDIAPTTVARRSPIIANGTFVDHNRIFPSIGLQGNRMQNPDKRRKYNLPKLDKLPDRDDMEARRHGFFNYHDGRVNFETIFCTRNGQTAIAPGNLVREFQESGQDCFEYKTKRPIANFFAFVSAKFLEKTEMHNGVKLRILYDKSHPYNVDKMMVALKGGLDSFTKSYGPYQYDHVRIMEFPYRSFAQSFAGTIPFSERIGFIQDDAIKDGEKIDLMTYVTMHELGHQYFGHQILPALTKGFNVLSESLSENAALSGLEDLQGWESAKRRRDRSADMYLAQRTVDKNPERPLGLVESSTYTWYDKGKMVFWGLQGYMGRDNVDAAMRDLLAEFSEKGAPYPTTLELIAALRTHADAPTQQFITDSFDRLTFWELGIEDPKVTPNTDGGYDVTFTLKTKKKVASEETGKEEETDLAEVIEVGLFKNNPSDTAGGEALVYRKITVTQESTSVTLSVDEKPAYVMADPRAYLIERNPKDNSVRLDTTKLASAE